MYDKVKESDWKTFRKLVPDCRERWLKDKNVELLKILTAPDHTPTEQFWDTLVEMKEAAKILQDCLDDHSRSRMFMKIMLMVRHGFITDQEMSTFSEELQAAIHANFELMKRLMRPSSDPN